MTANFGMYYAYPDRKKPSFIVEHIRANPDNNFDAVYNFIKINEDGTENAHLWSAEEIHNLSKTFEDRNLEPELMEQIRKFREFGKKYWPGTFT